MNTSNVFILEMDKTLVRGEIMDIEALDNELEQAISLYRLGMTSLIENFHLMTEDEQKYMLPQILDDMNRHALYTFVEFRANIMEYLKAESNGRVQDILAVGESDRGDARNCSMCAAWGYERKAAHQSGGGSTDDQGNSIQHTCTYRQCGHITLDDSIHAGH